MESVLLFRVQALSISEAMEENQGLLIFVRLFRMEKGGKAKLQA